MGVTALSSENQIYWTLKLWYTQSSQRCVQEVREITEHKCRSDLVTNVPRTDMEFGGEKYSADAMQRF